MLDLEYLLSALILIPDRKATYEETSNSCDEDYTASCEMK